MRTHLLNIKRYVLQRLQRCTPHLHSGNSSTHRHHDIEPHHMCKAMVKRQDNKRTPIFGNVYQRESLFHICRVVTVGQHHTFGVSRCSTRISDGSIVIILNRTSNTEEQFQRMNRQELLSHVHHLRKGHLLILVLLLCVKDNHFLHHSQLIFDGTYLLQLGTTDHDVLHISMFQTEKQVITFLQLDTERHIDGSGIEHSQFTNNPQITSLAEQGHGITFFHA